ncbi:MAG: HNH endonuclease [Gammaproteobacteria bacterium]
MAKTKKDSPRSHKLSLLRKRDGNKCGIHLGGCGKEFKDGEEINIDHIIPKSFLKSLGLSAQVYYRNDFLQPMHVHCNYQNKGGQVLGYPQFNCNCHYVYFDVKEKIPMFITKKTMIGKT